MQPADIYIIGSCHGKFICTFLSCINGILLAWSPLSCQISCSCFAFETIELSQKKLQGTNFPSPYCVFQTVTKHLQLKLKKEQKKKSKPNTKPPNIVHCRYPLLQIKSRKVLRDQRNDTSETIYTGLPVTINLNIDFIFNTCF